MLLLKFLLTVPSVFPLARAVSDSGDGDLTLLRERRVTDLAGFPSPTMEGLLPYYLSTVKPDGTWADVDYTSGCAARRANWPIQEHWNRVNTIASAWSGRNPAFGSNWTGNHDLLQAAKHGLDWWLARDFNSTDCLSQGGNATLSCPCGTPGLWNGNWFAQYILIPTLSSTACLILADELSSSQIAGCVNILQRVYDRSGTNIPVVGVLTGANIINVMQVSVSLGLLTNNASIVRDALTRAFSAVTFSDVTGADGIHRDGSFLQHSGVLYNGNYGKDFLNAFIQLEGEAIDTSFAADPSTHEPFATDARGSEWMIYVDRDNGQEHWDFSVIGRFVAFPTSDLQVTADINFNVSKLAKAVADFEGANSLNETIRRLQSNGSEPLVGNKAFWAADYMVHRRNNFTLGNKLVSSRTLQTEGLNGANPFGFHMGLGHLLSYVTGNEYKDIMAAWDWNLVPGTTSLLNLPILNQTTVGTSIVNDFVGTVSDGWVGTSVFDFSQPVSSNLRFRKAFFFLDDSVVILTDDIWTNSTAPIVTVLDNRKAAVGGILVDGEMVVPGVHSGHSLFYGGNGYLAYDAPFALNISEGNRTGNWSSISTSSLGVTTVPIFTAYTTVNSSFHAYAFFPASDPDRLAQEALEPSSSVVKGQGVTGVAGLERLSLVFWPGGDKRAAVDLSTIGWAKQGIITVTCSDAAVLLFATRPPSRDGPGVKTTVLVITLSDPTQSLTSLQLKLAFEGLVIDGPSDFNITLPAEGYAGASVTVETGFTVF